MFYPFPYINDINCVLPAIEGRPEFFVSEKDGYTVINYNVAFEDTFPSVIDSESPNNHAIRRECRGIIFDSSTGAIIRRPYHKFFNLNERTETLATSVDMSICNHILEKLDGSMICPFFLSDGRLIWGTKMGMTDVSLPVQSFCEKYTEYLDIAVECNDLGITPIFEWCSRKQRIVMDYPEDSLVLTAARHLNSGEYLPYDFLHSLSRRRIPIVNIFDPQTDLQKFSEYVKGLTDREGFVVRFDNGHMVKMKCDWYVHIHRAKEHILQDRNIIQLILDNKLDDIKAHLIDDDKDRIAEFENVIANKIRSVSSNIDAILTEVKYIDRKEFALNYAPKLDEFTKQVCFRLFDNHDVTEIHKEVCLTISKNLSNNTKYNNIRDIWFGGSRYNV